MQRGKPQRVVIAGDAVDPGLVARLADVRFELNVQPLQVDAVAAIECSVLVVDGSLDPGPALSFCRAVRAQLGTDGPPIVLLTSAHPDSRRQGLEQGAHSCLSKPFTIDELRSQIAAFLPWHVARNRMKEKVDDVQIVNQQLQAAYSQIQLDLELARRLQNSFLPNPLPEVGHARFAVWSRPFGVVGGDFYDIFRLDERHVGFYLADAMGHGVPACLLTVYLKKAIAPKEIHGNGYRLRPPNEVLSNLNRDLIEQKIPDEPFITMTYGLIDCFSGTVSLSRAGAPTPVVVSANGSMESLTQLRGTILGVLEASFESDTRSLSTGDRLVLLTDGAISDIPKPKVEGTLIQALKSTQGLPLQSFVDAVGNTIVSGDETKDDFSILALEFSGR